MTGAKYRTPYSVGTARTALLRSAYLRRYFDNPHVHALKVGNQQGVEPRSLFTRFRKVAQKCRPGERAVHVSSPIHPASCFCRGALALLPSRPLAAPSSFFRLASLANAVRCSSCCSACIHMLCVHTHAPRPHVCSPPRHLLASRWPLASHLHVRHVRMAALVASHAYTRATHVLVTSLHMSVIRRMRVTSSRMHVYSVYLYMYMRPPTSCGLRRCAPPAPRMHTRAMHVCCSVLAMVVMLVVMCVTVCMRVHT